MKVFDNELLGILKSNCGYMEYKIQICKIYKTLNQNLRCFVMMKKLILLVLATAFLLTGCQAKQAVSPAPTNSSTIAALTPLPSSASVTQKTAPPPQIDKIESASEDIIDDISGNDWAAAQSKVAQIKTNLSELKPILLSASVSTDIIDGISSAVDGLKTAVSSKESYESRLQANHISKYVPDIADFYISTLPTDIGRLDYLGWEIILNAENADWPSASNNFDIASGLWIGLKSKMSATYKNDIDGVQSNVDSLKAAIDKKDSSATTKQANALLENVDLLETDFTNQSKS